MTGINCKNSQEEYERAERYAERELETLKADEKEGGRELKRDKIAANKGLEMA